MEKTIKQENDSGSKGQGRGWRGDSEGHKRAGRLGGLARKRNRSNESEQSE